jgi:NADH dehydrogenase
MLFQRGDLGQSGGSAKVSKPQVVIVGAGFGGMQVAQSLKGAGAKIILIDRHNYSTFTPLLYQVATAQIEPEPIAFPIRSLLRSRQDLHFLQAEVQQLDCAQQLVMTDNLVIPYDYLVLATGSQPKFHSIAGIAEFGFCLRSLPDAIRLRNHLLTCLELAAYEPDPARREQLLTMVIVGGGPTGVEMAGALVELKQSLARNYPTLDLNQMKIVLLQSSNQLLTRLPERLSCYAIKILQRARVDVRLHAYVTQITDRAAHLQNGATISTATVIWTAGLEANYPESVQPLATASNSQLHVNSTLQLIDFANVYAIGDVAQVIQRSQPLTSVAPAALQAGVAVAHNLNLQISGKSPKPFRYFNKGRLAIIGCYAGVGKIGPFLLTGFVPWLMWLGVHLIYLPGDRSRLILLISYLHNYLWRDRAVSQILLTNTKLENRRHKL